MYSYEKLQIAYKQALSKVIFVDFINKRVVYRG